MKLTGIAWRGFSLPFRKKYATSGSQASSRRGLLLFLTTSDGLVGTGEASPVGPGSLEEVEKTVAILKRVAPEFIENDPDGLEASLPKRSLPAPLRFGIETALLDLRGQAKGIPLSVLLGGKPSLLPVNALIAAGSVPQAVIEAREAVKRGFTSLKLKVGGRTLSEDEDLVSAVRRTVGTKVKLHLDANQAWSVMQALESIRRLSRYQLEYVEQPVDSADIDGMAEVTRSVPIPVAADESLGSLDDLHRLLDAGAADIFIVKASRLGGSKATLEIAATAIGAGKLVVITTSLESGVGIAASAHLAAALPAQPYAHGLATGALFTDDLVCPGLLPSNGFLRAPDSPGLGVNVNFELLRKYGTAIIGSAGSLSGLPGYPGLQLPGETPGQSG